ncbi:MAG TPA: NAD(P)/FAD-dependent oxidoreductase [Candidatus Limnocylindrales bacterium]|nr:NAD(P)/FAD-dependent oxidoreductase [Candidatus Limnocylindrales bacterium]
MDRASVVIIGGGVVGCAIARAAAAKWKDVFLLEQMPKLGMGASSRNSGVIHSGLYYTPGSLKARLCVRGNPLTYEFCAAHGVPHRNTGKLVVATSHGQEPKLTELIERGRANGVEGLRIIDAAAIRAREPHIAGTAAIEVPSTGIVASEELVKAYARIAVEHGADIVTHAKVETIAPHGDLVRVTSSAGEVETRCLVNGAGLFADDVAARMGSEMAKHRIYPVRGEYCEIVRARSDLVRGLVYPLPHPEGLSLGVHLTKTLWGGVLVGPTAHYITDKNDYESNRPPIEDFVRMAQPMLPELRAEDLMPAYTGIRAKLAPPGSHHATDFIIARDPQFANVVQLIGMESPALTSAGAIAERVMELMSEILN